MRILRKLVAEESLAHEFGWAHNVLTKKLEPSSVSDAQKVDEAIINVEEALVALSHAVVVLRTTRSIS